MARALESNQGAGDSDVLEVNPVYVNLQYKHNSRMRALVELEANHLPRQDETETELEFERAYVQYSISDQHNVQLGKFFVPAGLWLPRHWRILAPTYDRVTFFENEEYYLVEEPVGIHYYGEQTLLTPLTVKYNFWISDGRESISKNHDESEIDNPGANLSFEYTPQYRSPLTSYELGMAYERVAASPTFPYDRRSLFAFSRFSLFDGDLEVVAELIDTELDGDPSLTSRKYRDLGDWYGSLQYQFRPRWWVYYRYELGDDPNRSRPDNPEQAILRGGPEPESAINTTALIWRPYAHTKVQLEYNRYQFQSDPLLQDDYDQFQMSFGRMF